MSSNEQKPRGCFEIITHRAEIVHDRADWLKSDIERIHSCLECNVEDEYGVQRWHKKGEVVPESTKQRE